MNKNHSYLYAAGARRLGDRRVLHLPALDVQPRRGEDLHTWPPPALVCEGFLKGKVAAFGA